MQRNSTYTQELRCRMH